MPLEYMKVEVSDYVATVVMDCPPVCARHPRSPPRARRNGPDHLSLVGTEHVLGRHVKSGRPVSISRLDRGAIIDVSA